MHLKLNKLRSPLALPFDLQHEKGFISNYSVVVCYAAAVGRVLCDGPDGDIRVLNFLQGQKVLRLRLYKRDLSGSSF